MNPPRWTSDVRPKCRRPARVHLSLDERRRMRSIVRRTRPRCLACGGTDLTVGPTMLLEFDAHRPEPTRRNIEVRCANRTCPTPVSAFDLAPRGQVSTRAYRRSP